MALVDRLREAWENHKEDNDMQKRFSGEWQERPTDTEDRTIKHLQRITQPTIDHYVADSGLDHIRNASPEQVEELAGKIQKATGITESNARAAVDLQQSEYRPALSDGPQEMISSVRYPADAYPLPEVSPRAVEAEQGQGSRGDKHLKESVGVEHASEFVWKQDSGDIKSYQHQATGNHVHFDSSGQFYNQEREPITREAAISHAVSVPGIEIASPAPNTPNPERSQATTAATPELPFAVTQPAAQLPPNEQAISL